MYSGNSGRATYAAGYGATVSGVKNAPNKKSNRQLTKSPGIPAVKERILVESHEAPIREIVSVMLTAAGYVCRQAASPNKVLDILNGREEYELLLCNLSESLDAGLIERMNEKFPDIPVVIMTAIHDISVPLAAIRNGAYDYLLKPFEREQLLAVVRRALEYRRLRLQNRALRAKLAKEARK